MSDELIFDSERQEMRDRKKTWLIPLLVLAGILIAVVVVSLLLRSGKKPVNNGGDDTSYPFTWQVQADGSVLLSLPHADAPDARWELTGEELYQALRAEAEGEKNGSSHFRLIPAQAGRALLELTLRKDAEGGTEDSYLLSLLTEVGERDGKLSVSILNSSGVRLQSELSGGEDSGNGYRVFRDERGFLVIAVKYGAGETDWDYEVVSGQDSIRDYGLQYTNGEVQVLLKAGEVVGEGELVLRSEAAGAELRFRCAAQEDGSLLITDHRASYARKPEPAGTEASAETESTGEAEAATVEPLIGVSETGLPNGETYPPDDLLDDTPDIKDSDPKP